MRWTMRKRTLGSVSQSTSSKFSPSKSQGTTSPMAQLECERSSKEEAWLSSVVTLTSAQMFGNTAQAREPRCNTCLTWYTDFPAGRLLNRNAPVETHGAAERDLRHSWQPSLKVA